MKHLNIDRINAKAPYKVSEDGKQLLFETRHGLHYEIRFFEEQPIGGCSSFVGSNSRPSQTASPSARPAPR